MKNFILILLPLFLLIPAEHLRGQTPGSTADLFQLSEELGNLVRQVDRGNVTDNGLEVIGTRYADEQFRESVLIQGEVEIPGIYARYDALGDEVEMKINASDAEEEVYAVKKDPLVRCRVGNDLFVYTNFKNDEGVLSGYLVSLVSGGPYKLYKRKWVYFREGRVSDDPLKPSMPNKFVHKEEVLAGVNGEVPEVVKLRKNKVLELVSESDLEVARQILKERGYKLKDEAELADFFGELNARN